MKLFVKVFLITLSLSCWSSFAVKDNYVSILKKDTTKVRTFSEFQSNMKKDFLDVRREVAGQSILVFIKETEDNNKESSEKSNPSTI